MVDFTVLAFEDAFGTGVSATLDILAAARKLAAPNAAPAPTWRVCSMQGGPVRLASGLLIETDRLPLGSRSDRSTWVLPGLALDDAAAIEQGLARTDVRALAAAIPRHLRRGGRVAACCSAVFVLGTAGVLDGRRATTSWWLASLLQRLHPRCEVDANVMVCADDGVVTGGAAFAQSDLMLHLLRDRCGTRVADALSRFLLIDGREAQGAYVVPEMLANGDALVSRLVARIERSLPEPPTVTELAREIGISDRTLARRVQRATGRSTAALIQGVKLRKARALLEQSRYSVEDIAAAVGYSDPTALRRLMKKAMGSTPSEYRPAAASKPAVPGRPPGTPPDPVAPRGIQ
jgi:transcriptional regulator GlxA family with amidase domain